MIKKNNKNNKLVLLTGATGFIGEPLVYELLKSFKRVRVLVRKKNFFTNPRVEEFLISDITNSNLDKACYGVDITIHLAASVHNLNTKEDIYRKVNFFGTINIARASERAKVKKFIFLSTIKVNGEYTLPNFSFTAHDTPSPSGAYAKSKLDAENFLLSLSKKSKMKVVIIRPPLIYGPNAKGNFNMIVKFVNLKLPLPFAAINKNYRSLIGLKNLIDFILVCCFHPKANNQIFLVKDSADLSTMGLVSNIGSFFNKKIFCIYIPEFILSYLFILIGKSYLIDRLIFDLRVDITKNKKLLSWSPKYTFFDCMSGNYNKSKDF